MPEQTAAQQLVVFSLGEEEYALPISYVHEIIRFTEPRSVASEDPSVRGVISLRGKILPVFDLAARLGVETGQQDGEKIVIVETQNALAGVVVDDVEEVLTVEGEQVDAGDTWAHVNGACIDGIAKVEDRLVVLLSPDQIVAERSAIDYEETAVGQTEAAPAQPDAAPAEQSAVAA